MSLAKEFSATHLIALMKFQVRNLSEGCLAPCSSSQTREGQSQCISSRHPEQKWSGYYPRHSHLYILVSLTATSQASYRAIS